MTMKNENKLEVIEAEVTVIDSEDDSSVKPEILEVLEKSAAEQLTRDIQSTTTALYVLLKKAHDTKAWLSLGYKTWTEYIEKEFDFSRARSYQLINQANVIEEINEASGVPLYITEREARSIKKRLPEITEQLKEIKDADLPGEVAEEKVMEVLEDKDNIDNSNGHSDQSDGLDREFDEQDNDGDMGDYNSERKGSNELSEEDKFIYERLLMTLRIFESMPNPAIIGEKIKYSGEDKRELTELAEKSHDWTTKFLGELKQRGDK